MEFLDIVNEKNEIVGRASKKEIYEKLLPHRIVHILVFNDKGEMALQLQSKYKSFCPRHWCTAAAGHVKAGESCEEAALRELEEELGVKAAILPAYKDVYEYKSLKKIIVTFKTVFNGPFNINPNEVEGVKFFSLGKIREMIRNGEKFHPELLFLLGRHF